MREDATLRNGAFLRGRTMSNPHRESRDKGSAKYRRYNANFRIIALSLSSLLNRKKKYNEREREERRKRENYKAGSINRKER